MIKLDTYQPRILSTQCLDELKTARRLVVPVFSPETDLTAITHSVWAVASATGAHIQFLGLCNDVTQEPSLRRMLITAAATVNYGNVSAESHVVLGRDWMATLKSHLQKDDMVICWNEKPSEMAGKPLSQLLRSNLGVPLYFLSGTQNQVQPRSNWLSQAAAWIGSLVILIAFFILQVRITQLAQNWTIVLQLLAISVELYLVLVWNNLFA